MIQLWLKLLKFLQTILRKTDYVGRWGREEFISCLNIDVHESTRLTNKLLNKTSQHSFYLVSETITASTGGKSAEKYTSLHGVIRNAGNALYHEREWHKASGINNSRITMLIPLLRI